MKTNLWKFAAVLAVGFAAITACEQAEIDPVFPEEVQTNDNVTTTSETIEFTANLDWDLTVPQETISFFWLEDADGNRLSKLTGKAGTFTATLGITDEPLFEEDITCDVTLTMGGESKVIATFTIKKSEREFKALPCKVSDGKLVYKPTGGYDYMTTEPTDITMACYNKREVLMPLEFVANFNYDVVSEPDWMHIERVSDSDPAIGVSGTTHVTVSVDLANIPEDVTEGSFEIKVRNTDVTVATITVKLPDLGLIAYTDMATVQINADGAYNTYDHDGNPTSHENCVLSVHTAADLTLVIAGPDENGKWSRTSSESNSYDYATVTVGEKSGSMVLKAQDVTVDFEPNSGAQRSAYLFAVPSDDMNSFDEFLGTKSGAYSDDDLIAKYLVVSFTQDAGADDFSLTATNAELADMDDSDSMYTVLLNKFKTSNIYTLSATSQFTLNYSSNASPSIYSYQYDDVTENYIFEDGTSDWGTPEASETTLTLSASKKVTSYIVFTYYALGETERICAVVAVTYEPSVEGGDTKAPFTFVYPSMVSGATLSLFDNPESLIGAGMDFDGQGVTADNIWQLTYSVPQPSMAMINFSGTPDGDAWNNYPAVNDYWLSYSVEDGQLMVDMHDSGKTDYIVFREEGMMKYILVCKYEYIPAFAFAYPDYVQGAKLEPYDNPQSLMGEFYGVTAQNIWKLTYTQAQPVMSMINYSGDGILVTDAWNNYPPVNDYWLTYSNEDGMLSVVMTEVGKTDYIVYQNASGLFTHVLVCTREQ